LALFANSSLPHAAIHILLRHSSRKNLSNPVRKVRSIMFTIGSH